ncbi:hypothetical protein QUA00_08335 [Microcoleus sp. T2B6]|uniref:hypothetical protein n=1 Tax=Microcoleus sp. T2B6 TaxID=3055424 RepID=UPI002FD52FFE
MPKVDRQGAKVRSAAAFVTFCAMKLSDAQQKPSSNRRIAGSPSPKRRNRVHCQQTISALGESQAKQVRENFLPVTFHAGIIHCGDKFLFFCLLQTFTSRKSNWATVLNSLIIS